MFRTEFCVSSGFFSPDRSLKGNGWSALNLNSCSKKDALESPCLILGRLLLLFTIAMFDCSMGYREAWEDDFGKLAVYSIKSVISWSISSFLSDLRFELWRDLVSCEAR